MYPDSNALANPLYFQENRLPAHSTHLFTTSLFHNMRMDLNGLWKFAYARNFSAMVPDFMAADFDCHSWEEIVVPAHLQMEGYGKPHYVNAQYPWEGHEEIHPGEIPTAYNPIGQYVKYFSLPPYMAQHRVRICLEGVESAFSLWCNGAFVGYSEDSFTPSEFDLTDFLVKGENKLALVVYQWTASSWCEDQDFFRFSGIFRDVYLYAVPKVHVQDVKVRPVLNKDFTKAEVEITLTTCGNGSLQAKICPLAHQTLYGQKADMHLAYETKAPVAQRKNLAFLNGQESNFTLSMEAPLLWSAEAPHLYLLSLEIFDETGSHTESVSQHFGVRHFAIVDGLMQLNGRRIVFKGVNRHEFSALRGRVPNLDELWQDLITMKQNNINAIRTSHYPNQQALYDLCDRLGLYVIDECNLESHGTWEPFYNGLPEENEVLPRDREAWAPMLLDRANSMLQRDKNHPCILLWSCGNESHGGSVIHAMSQFFKEKDPDRLVHYEGIFHDRTYPDTSDVESQMYTPAAEIAAWLKKDRSKPFICCEYTHAMGNSCGAMDKYTDLTDTEPLYQGGFIWDYVDQSIYKKNRYGAYFQAYGGDFADRPNDGNFSGNGIVYGGDRKPSAKMQAVKFNYQNIAVDVTQKAFVVKNKFLFTDTSAFDCILCITRMGKLFYKEKIMTQVPPLGEATYAIPYELPLRPGEYVITVSFHLKEETDWAKAGHEIAFGQCVVRHSIPEKTLFFPGLSMGETLPSFNEYATLQVHKSHHAIGIVGEHFSVMFNYYGSLLSYVYGGREMLVAPPKPNFWRAPTDNDRGAGMMKESGQWKLASLYQGCAGGRESVKIEDFGGKITLRYQMELFAKPIVPMELTYSVYADGTVAMQLSYDPEKIEGGKEGALGLGNLPAFGFLFTLDADYDKVSWYGYGPAETYIDRQKGAKLGLYENTVAESMSAYLVPQECGNHTGVRYAKVCDLKDRGLVFSGDNMEFSALPYAPEALEQALHPYELPPVHYTFVRCNLAQMGVGGDNSWGAKTHPEYCLPPDKAYTFFVSFKGITGLEPF